MQSEFEKNRELAILRSEFRTSKESENVVKEKFAGLGANKVLILTETSKDGKFLKRFFRTEMSIPMHFGVNIQAMISVMSNRCKNDEFKKDILSHYYVAGLFFNKKTHTLLIHLEILKCFDHLKYIIFERSGLFPQNILQFVFLSNF